VRSTNNETRVERNRLQVRQHYGVIEKFLERNSAGFSILFFCAVKSRWFLRVFLHFWTHVPLPTKLVFTGT
jgi:hypothetical protein